MIHIPVMLKTMLSALEPKAGEVYVDATFGAGGYSRAILEAAPCIVYGIDRDPDAILRAQPIKQIWKEQFHILKGNFAQMVPLLHSVGVEKVDGIVMDLGVSSPQLDEAERGFSFQRTGPLDMRMEKDGVSAADIVNTWGESDLADLIYLYGEERNSRRIARAIVHQRKETPFKTTRQLADVILRAYPAPTRRDKIHPATLTFQALRIKVNEELRSLEKGLEACESLLAPGGRLVVLSFHSLEDRIVKNFIRQRSQGAPAPSRHLPSSHHEFKPTFEVLRKKSIGATKAEMDENRRARSAHLRLAYKVSSSLEIGRGQ